jgi:hypothetical protein
VAITWTIDVQPAKYLALLFTVTNPMKGHGGDWNVHEHLADGSIVEWSDKPNAEEKASVTKIG